MSKTLSIMPAPFSNDIEYEKPEQPPPTTPTRRPAGTGFCCAMISLTLAIAFAVRLIGAVFALVSGFTSGVVVVAICISLKLRINVIITKTASRTVEKGPDRTFWPAWPTMYSAQYLDDPIGPWVAAHKQKRRTCQPGL